MSILIDISARLDAGLGPRMGGFVENPEGYRSVTSSSVTLEHRTPLDRKNILRALCSGREHHPDGRSA